MLGAVRHPLVVDRMGDVYNITVRGLHNYFADGVLVHNKPD